MLPKIIIYGNMKLKRVYNLNEKSDLKLVKMGKNFLY